MQRERRSNIIYNLNGRYQASGNDSATPGRGRPTVILENCVMAPVIAKPSITETMRCLMGVIEKKENNEQPRALL